MKILALIRNIVVNLATQLLLLLQVFLRFILKYLEEIKANLGDSKPLLSQVLKELGKGGMTLCLAALIFHEKASPSNLVIAFSISLAVWVVGFTLRKTPPVYDSTIGHKQELTRL